MVTLIFILLFVAALGFGIYKAFGLGKDTRGNTTINFNLARVVPGVLLAIPFFLLAASYTQVDSGTVGVVYRQGRAVRAVEPGPHFLIPFLEGVAPVSVKTLIWQPNENGASNDLQQVTTQVTLAYHFDPAYAVYFATQLISAEPNSVENKVVNPAIVEAVKATTAQYNATDLIQKRPLVRDDIDKMVKTRLAQYHIVVETVSITDFQFTKEYNDSIEAKVKAQQDAERAQNELVKTKIDAQKAEAEAKGTAAANVATAEGEAKAIIAKADAQAKANRELASSLTPALIQNKAIDKWDGARPLVEGGGKGTGLLIQIPSVRPSKASNDDNN